MYPDIINSIDFYLKLYHYEYKIFETWHEISTDVRDRFQKEFEILGDLGKPDIMVFLKKEFDEEYKVLIIEAKVNSIVLKDIAQAKMYGDLYDADYVFLVSPEDLRRNIIRYSDTNKNLFRYSDNKLSLKREVKFIKISDKNLLINQPFPTGELFYDNNNR